MRRLTRRRFLGMTAATGALGVVAGYPLFIERHIVVTNTYKVPVRNLPAPFTGFRIVHLTDLHHGFMMPASAIRRVVERANAIPRDLVVCTGDYVHERNGTSDIDSVWPQLGRLTAPHGVWSVLGNHDHWADSERSRHWLRRTGQNLRHKLIPIEKDGERLWLAGAGDLWEDHRSLDHMLGAVPKNDCRIVLAHNPDTADDSHRARVDLMLSGHTHGGQVKVPFVGSPVLPVRNKAYTHGLKRSPRGTPVFISRGIGWSVLPVRFNCTPEIAVLELVPV